MNKREFIKYIAEKHDINEKEAKRVVDVFTCSVIDALGEGKEITLIGFGNFAVTHVEARTGHNPKTGAPIKINAYRQPKFKAGKKLKDAVN